MPTYVYKPTTSCRQCQGQFEVVQRMSEEALAVCPHCGKQCKKIPTAPNITGVSKSKLQEKAKQLGFKTFKRERLGKYKEI